MKTGRNLLWLAMTLAGISWMVPAPARGAAFADVPLYFGITNGVTDEHGQLLDGSVTVPGALVQILSAPNGVYPPHADGSPNTNNAVLKQVQIGQGTDPAAGSLGKVSGSVVINRYQANKMFARIFNRPTMEDASFYVDSPLYTNSTTAYGVFIISVSQTDQPIDTGDDDGDGLMNSGEKSIGTDRLNPDSDGDGMNDYYEVLAGTDAMDDTDFLQMVQVMPQAGGNVVVKWDSVPGKTYQLQHTTKDLMAPDIEFMNVHAPITADAYEVMTVVTNISATVLQHFRVKLVTP